MDTGRRRNERVHRYDHTVGRRGAVIVGDLQRQGVMPLKETPGGGARAMTVAPSRHT